MAQWITRAIVLPDRGQNANHSRGLPQHWELRLPTTRGSLAMERARPPASKQPTLFELVSMEHSCESWLRPLTKAIRLRDAPSRDSPVPGISHQIAWTNQGGQHGTQLPLQLDLWAHELLSQSSLWADDLLEMPLHLLLKNVGAIHA
jgi:hypothetical protein